MINLSPFEGKVVLITGARSGIGRATALATALASGGAGATITLGDLDEKAAETAIHIVAAGGAAIFVKTGDSMSPSTCRSAASDAASFVTGQTYVIDGSQTSHAQI